MPRRFSTAEVARSLERLGILFVRQEGSHLRYRGVWRGQERNVTLVAGQKQIPARTLVSILRQANITRAELECLIAGEQPPA